MTIAFMAASQNRGQQVLACKMCLEIVPDQLAHGLAGLKRSGGVMRLQQHIVQIQKTRVERRFAFEDVQCRRARGFWLSSASSSAASSMLDARLILMIMPSAPTASITSRLTIWRVCADAARVTNRKSDRLASSTGSATKVQSGA